MCQINCQCQCICQHVCNCIRQSVSMYVSVSVRMSVCVSLFDPVYLSSCVSIILLFSYKVSLLHLKTEAEVQSTGCFSSGQASRATDFVSLFSQKLWHRFLLASITFNKQGM